MALNIDSVKDMMERERYVTDQSIATTVFLSLKLKKPILIEGAPGSGKTEIAKVLAQMLKAELIRLQCYEGLDANTALYEWDYPRQMLRIRLEEAGHTTKQEIEASIFSEQYLLKRPLLRAVLYDGEVPPVLLIDEIDRADEEFEGFLLEVLSDFQVSIPEMGTLKAKENPIVCLTSNMTREIGDALKRRCLYLFIEHPTFDKEYRIVKSKVPDASDALAAQVCGAMQRIRDLRLSKKPGIAETLDWTTALVALDETVLTPENVDRTLGCIIKHRDDIEKVKGPALAKIVDDTLNLQ